MSKRPQKAARFALGPPARYHTHMMPTAKQRATVVIGLLLAGACYAVVAAPAMAEGTVGLTLIGGATGARPLLMLLALSLPVLAIALLTASMGNPLAGPFVFCGGLVAAAGLGGSIDGWLRAIESPAAFWRLAVESLIWAGLLVLLRLLIRSARGRVRRHLPAPMRSGFCEELKEPARQPSQQAGVAAGCVLLTIGAIFAIQRAAVMDYIAILLITLVLVSLAWVGCLVGQNLFDRSAAEASGRAAMGPAFLAGIVTAAVGAALLMFFQQSPDSGQVIGAMLVSFTAAALLAHQLFPTAARLPMLLAPLCVAFATYAWMAVSNDSASHVLLRYFTDFSQAEPPIITLPPLALALPVFYASAGVAGVALGVGWSQTIHAGADRHVVVTG